MKNKNLILIVISFILFCYAITIGILPIIYNGKLKSKAIIPELERLTLLKIDYDSAKLKVNPNLSVYVRFNDVSAQKRDIDMQVAKAAKIEMVMGLGSLFSKKYELKSMKISGADYFEVLDHSMHEIVYFLKTYSLLAENGHSIRIKTCPIEIKFLKKHTYNRDTKVYSEQKFDEYEISPESFADFIKTISNEQIKTSY